jgi:biopolymer transport protein ExbB
MKKTTIGLILVLGAVIAAPAGAQEQPARPDPRAALEQLLRDIQQTSGRETRENREREQRFLADKAQQQRLLNDAKAELSSVEQRSDELKTTYDGNEKELSELETVLNERLGSLGEMFGVVRLVAGDTKGLFDGSLVSAQIPGRQEFLSKLAASKALPQTEELEKLWFELLREAVESGKVVQFQADVVAPDGTQAQRQVTRIGVYNAVADGRYLKYDTDTGRLIELERQPGGDATSLAADFEVAASGYVPFAVDPSRGAILSLLIQTPSYMERLNQGGAVGWVIVALGAVGLLIVVWRFFALQFVGSKVSRQLKSDTPSGNNPLGRVMAAYHEDKTLDTETLNLKLDEAILKEMPPLERGLTAIKIVAAVAPLLGLLGTVTGMILTFQQITLFGTGDPKLMADGISQALVTTMEGLTVAIPLVLLHGFLSGKSQSLVQILDEQAAGMVAEHAESRHVGNAA